MQTKIGVIFGAVVAYILLVLYAGIVSHMVGEVISCANPENTVCKSKEFHEGMKHVVTLIGGLVSALVVAQLAVSPSPKKKSLRTDPSAASASQPPVAAQPKDGVTMSKQFLQALPTILSITYLSVWLIVGLAALVFGVLVHPEISSTVSDIGTTWLGLAVASGYAYFGLDVPVSG